MELDLLLHDWAAASDGGVRILHPSDWRGSSTSATAGSILVLQSPDASPDGFRPNITIVDRPGSEPNIEAVLDIQIAQLREFPDAIVLDAELTELARQPATRALAAYRADDEDELTLEQWIVPCGPRLVTVSATSASSHHAEVAELLCAIATTLEIHRA